MGGYNKADDESMVKDYSYWEIVFAYVTETTDDVDIKEIKINSEEDSEYIEYAVIDDDGTKLLGYVKRSFAAQHIE